MLHRQRPPSPLLAPTFLTPLSDLGEIPGLSQPDLRSPSPTAAGWGVGPFLMRTKSPALLPVVRNLRRRPGFQPVGERRALPGVRAHVPRRARVLPRSLPGSLQVGVGGGCACARGRSRPRPGMGAGGGPRAGRAGGAGRRPRRGRRAPASGPGVPARRRGGDGGTGQGGPAAGPGLAEKLIRKKSKKKRLCHSKAREVRGKPGSGPGGAVVRPPKAPEDFSPNWKALQEVRLGGSRSAPLLPRWPPIRKRRERVGPRGGRSE